MYSFLCSLACLVLLGSTGAASWPTSGNAAASSELDLKLALIARQDVAGTVLIGDLRTGAITPVGFSIANILSGSEEAQTTAVGYVPPKLGTDSCATDECCVWSYLSQELTKKFTGPSGRCNNDARAAIRLGFHDAGTWSSKLAATGQDFGRADGSIVLSPDEAKRPENKGLLSIINDMKQIQRKWGVGMADLIQFAATHAVVTCPLGPRIRFFVGRSDSVKNAPDNLLPSVTASADALVALFEDKTISSHELAALLGAHSVSRQFFSNTTTGGQPQDSTPGVWDTRFYNETQAGTTKGVYQLPSDVVLAADPRMATEWAMFRRPGGIGQLHWNSDYAKAFTRLSLLGVNNINQLVECSKVLPLAKPTFAGADQVLITE